MQVCSSNSETPGLQFKQWDPRSEAQILRTKVCGSNTESPGLHFMSCRPGISIFELQTLGLSIWTADQGSHCLNCRPGVSLFELQTRGPTVWTADLGSRYLITDLRSQYLICRPDLQVQLNPGFKWLPNIHCKSGVWCRASNRLLQIMDHHQKCLHMGQMRTVIKMWTIIWTIQMFYGPF